MSGSAAHAEPGADLDTACSEEQERDGHQGEHHRDQQHARHGQVQAACGLLCAGWRGLLPCSQTKALSALWCRQDTLADPSDCTGALVLGT